MINMLICIDEITCNGHEITEENDQNETIEPCLSTHMIDHVKLQTVPSLGTSNDYNNADAEM